MSQVVARLYGSIGDPGKLAACYDEFVGSICAAPFWRDGKIEFCRVHLSDARHARSEDRETFNLRGLYLWGAKNRPLYIGITRGTFCRRFSRYVWQTQSQCNLAREFGESLVIKGIEGFPHKIRRWYARSYGGSTVRLCGAVRFAEEGIGDIWFALFPHDIPGEAAALERCLVPIAEDWNHKHGSRSLLNIEFNTARA